MLLTACLLVSGIMAPDPARGGPVLDRVRANGYVTCAINYLAGFSGVTQKGEQIGLDVDYCRAVAAAVLEDPDAIRLSRVNSHHKFDAIRNGEVDIGFALTTWTFDRETSGQIAFTSTIYHDAQGFLAWADTGITDLKGVARATVCVQQHTSTHQNLMDWLQDKPQARAVVTATSEEKVNAFAERECQVITGDISELTAYHQHHSIDPSLWRMVSGSIFRSPLTPIVWDQDREWERIVRWVNWVPMLAELHGLTRADLATALPGRNAERRRLLGADPGFGKGLGLDPGWARRVIATTGNYAEMFERHFRKTGADRGPNRLWRDGGLFDPPPLN